MIDNEYRFCYQRWGAAITKTQNVKVALELGRHWKNFEESVSISPNSLEETVFLSFPICKMNELGWMNT